MSPTVPDVPWEVKLPGAEDHCPRVSQDTHVEVAKFPVTQPWELAEAPSLPSAGPERALGQPGERTIQGREYREVRLIGRGKVTFGG